MVMYTIVPIVWLIGTSITIIMMMIGNINLGYQVAKAKKVEDNAMKLILMKCKARLAITKKIEIKLQKQHTSPCIYGVIRPKILVSEEFMTRDSDVIENVFMHELSHYKRKDMITNYLLLIVTAIHWFNPFVYGFFKKIRQEMELATDEIALSKMNKEQKKQYGLTLISLLQTYETDKVATKMLCITDDNKNMERRIQKIKLATKLKKYRKSIIMLITSIVICMVIPFVLKPSNLANSLKQEERYEQVRQYLVDLEQRNHDLDNEESLTKGDYVETIIDIVKLGMKQNGDQIDVYVLAFIKSYNNQDNIVINENLMPYKFIIKDDKIVDYQIPEEGENYEKSLEKIFPDDIRKQIEESQEKINQEKNESEYNINLNENYNLQE